MRGVLVDNSTLTSIQRLLGLIPVHNKSLIDSDIIALENMLQMILFYDKIFFLNDYKEQFQQSRKEYFHWLTPIEKQQIEYNELLSQARLYTEDIVPTFAGGRFKDGDFAPFFEMLKMNVTFTWDISSSVYFLTQKLLSDVGGIDIEKYSTLSAMIYDELSEKKEVNPQFVETKMKIYNSSGQIISEKVQLRDKYGKQVDGEISKQVNAFFAGLNWLAFRTVLYTMLARELQCDLFLHHIRDGFHINMLNNLQKDNPSVLKPAIDTMKGISSRNLNAVLENTQPYVTKFNLPMFSVWFATKTGRPSDFFEYAFEIREEKMFKQARSSLATLDRLHDENPSKYVKEANLLIKDIQKQMERIRVKYGVDTPQGVPLAPLIGVWNATTLVTQLPKSPKVNMRIKQLDFLKDLIPAKGFKAIYRSVLNDLTQVSRLGKYYDIISADVVLKENAQYYQAKEEQIKYAKSKSWWKLPL
ncbi:MULTISPECIES: hypothetical protein [unclassified Lysinibacillus]|uniref:hypothetical protein n=1 Tax=unclassified Lysinibacillus TaxID=2636778 RepID=UPI00088A9A38|nr:MULTISPECIES: hypothetical protein [unclassified Lysinibacillus]SCY34344.1 hypothetical protein SAMN02787078_01291 [Lysinibacillus sp. SG9]SDB17705.1 hypothetical protein SAMN02787079_01293 [Lysinibacillus sp. TC-37]SFS65253.1 hypothetical protein SAMN02787087_01298 [Lysinibacillus sp. SG55]